MTQLINKRILYPELSYKLTGLCFHLQKELGRFCREKQYADIFEKLLKESKISYLREYELSRLVNNSPTGNRVDFLVENIIILEFKAKKFITKEDYIQMQRYLIGGNFELGLLVNFRQTYLKPKRVLNSHYKFSDNSNSNSDYSDRYKHEQS